jgi:hypothetical protein
LAIRRHGIYAYDQVDLLHKADEDDLQIASDLLVQQYQYEKDPGTYQALNNGLALSPLERCQELPRSAEEAEEWGNPYDRFGWPRSELPEFDKIGQPESEVEEQPVVKVKRRAPDAFVAAFVRLLVEIAKRDPTINIDEMHGTKKDLLAVAIKFSDKLECSPTTFDTYIERLCKFKSGSRHVSYYEELFPEYFK